MRTPEQNVPQDQTTFRFLSGWIWHLERACCSSLLCRGRLEITGRLSQSVTSTDGCLLLRQVKPPMAAWLLVASCCLSAAGKQQPSASRASASPCAGDKLLPESFLPIVLGKRTGEDYCCCWLLSLPLTPLGGGANPSLWCGNKLLDSG